MLQTFKNCKWKELISVYLCCRAQTQKSPENPGKCVLTDNI